MEYELDLPNNFPNFEPQRAANAIKDSLKSKRRVQDASVEIQSVEIEVNPSAKIVHDRVEDAVKVVVKTRDEESSDEFIETLMSHGGERQYEIEKTGPNTFEVHFLYALGNGEFTAPLRD